MIDLTNSFVIKINCEEQKKSLRSKNGVEGIRDNKNVWSIPEEN